MPRNNRKAVGGNLHHVIVRGVAKEAIFEGDNNKGFYLTCLKNAKLRYDVFIIAFVVMDTHAHILVETDVIEDMSNYFHLANSEYAKYFNYINERKGHVFGDRFKNEVILNERHLFNCVAYIHNNPVKANIVQYAKDYGHSSYTNFQLRTGIVDLDKAANFFDTSIENIDAMILEKTPTYAPKWEETIYEDFDTVAAEILARRSLQSFAGMVKNKPLTKQIAQELITRCNAPLTALAKTFLVSRPTISKIILE